MNWSPRRNWPTVVAGFGSPHGEDRAGWRIVELLEQRARVPARVVAVRESTQLLAALDGCRRLIIVDSCRSGGNVGEITRLRWPDPRIKVRHGQSTHGMGVADVLLLADRLASLPPIVDVFGIEITDYAPGSEFSLKVLQAVTDLEAVLFEELHEVAHA